MAEKYAGKMHVLKVSAEIFDVDFSASQKELLMGLRLIFDIIKFCETLYGAYKENYVYSLYVIRRFVSC